MTTSTDRAAGQPSPAAISWRPVHTLLVGLLSISFALLMVVAAAGESAAKPGLGAGPWWTAADWGWAPGPALVTGMLWAAYLLGAGAVLLHLRTGLPSAAARWLWILLLVTFVTASPFGSADHTNYAAYGQIAAHGGDPYLTPPNAWSTTDPITTAVRPPWDGTTSIYGPFATLLQAAAAHLGQDNLRQTVWVWRLVVLLSWFVVRLAADRLGADRSRTDALWTFNPLVLGVGVLGAHVDMVAAALALATLWAARRFPWLAGLLAGLAVSTKVTYGVVVLAVPLAWWVHGRRRFPVRTTQFVGAALAVTVPLHLWAGPHVFDQLDRARRSISLATPWRLLLQVLDGPLGDGAARTLISVLAVGLFGVLTAALGLLTRRLVPPTFVGAAARWAFVLTTAYALSAPYSLPWYLLLTWALLPLLAASVLDAALLVHFAAMALAYVPGRVDAMTTVVERTTLWVRRTPVPYAVLVVWGWLTLAAARGWRRPAAPRPPAP